MPVKPKNIILIIADSLRYDSVYNDGIGLPYTEKNAVQFSNVSSAACWTLPATSSIFTGVLPHEHQATTQTRALKSEKPTLAEIMKSKGYNTYQVTSNVATTEIFGLDKGFDDIFRAWQLEDPIHNKFWSMAMLMGKPRIRKKVMSKRVISDDLSQDLRAGSVWFQNFRSVLFNKAHQLINQNEAKGEGTFIFLNLMETHFPYHIDNRFKCESDSILAKIKELKTLYGIVNQSFLKDEEAYPDDKMLELLKNRQKKSWRLIREELDQFIQSLHEDKDNLVIFASDHGENFGDQDWLYHFSNVTDACTRVPIFWLDHKGMTPGVNHNYLSSRLLYHSLAKSVGYEDIEGGQDLFEDNVLNTPISQSYWYDSQGRTLEKFKYNQFCFKYNGERYLKKLGEWYFAKATDYEIDESEPVFESMKGFNPVEEIQDKELKAHISSKVEGFDRFESKIKS